jgi:hypothetical protein
MGLVNLGDEGQPEYAWDPMVADALEYLALVMYSCNYNLFQLVKTTQAITTKRTKERKCFLSPDAHINCHCAEKGYTPDLATFINGDGYPEYRMATLQECQEAYHCRGEFILYLVL